MPHYNVGRTLLIVGGGVVAITAINWFFAIKQFSIGTKIPVVKYRLKYADQKVLPKSCKSGSIRNENLR